MSRSTPHRLSAVWFADLVGYSRLAARDEAAALRRVRCFQEAARETADRYDGRIVKFLGDGALAEFPSTDSAVRAAADLRLRLEAACGEGTIRVGVHLGDVTPDPDGDLYGDGVNVSSRLQSLAEPGQVVVSEDVYRQLRPRREFRFAGLGTRELEGMDEPLDVYAVEIDAEDLAGVGGASGVLEVGPEEPGLPAALKRPAVLGGAAIALLAVVTGLCAVFTERGDHRTASRSIATAGPGIAILPFGVNDPDHSGLREGMIDALSYGVDGAAGLRAIDSRTVLARWNERVPEDRMADLRTQLEVARATGGRYGLVGSVISSGETLRLIAEVYDLEDGRSLGQRQVEGAADSIFGLVDRLSFEVLDILLDREQMEDLPRIDLAAVTTPSLPALKSFLEGETLFRRSDFDTAIPAYERAIAADSAFALAHARLGAAHAWIDPNDPRVLTHYRTARRHVDRLPPREADLLDVSLAYTSGDPEATARAEAVAARYPDDPEAQYLLGEARFHLPHQSVATREEKNRAFVAAIRLDPSYTPAYIHLMDLAFEHADSVALDTLFERYDGMIQRSGYEAKYQVARALAWGDSSDRLEALATLDTLPPKRAGPILGLVSHPRNYSLVIHAAERILDVDEMLGIAHVNRLGLLLESGRLRRFAEFLETPDVPEQARVQGLAYAYLAAAPLPPETFGEAFEIGPADTIPSPLHVVAALHALDRGDVGTARTLRGRIEATAPDLEAAGDTTMARGARAMARAIEGRAAMLAGDHERAIELLDGAYRTTGAHYLAAWIAAMHAEAGRTAEAIRYYEQLGPNPWIGLELGRLYEANGQRTSAFTAYGWVVNGWEGADPPLQRVRAEARTEIARLRGLQRT